MRLDLHVHTTASDGTWSPEAVVRGAAEGGLDVLAITDHDTVAALPSAREVAGALRIHLIEGIEVSSTHEHRDVHVLGYGIDLDAPSIVSHTERAQHRREERMYEMLDALETQGIVVPFEEVERAAGPDRGVLGRPHLARALVEVGHATSVPDAFRRWIGDDCPAFVPTSTLDPEGAVRLIADAGGVPVWAHPPGDLLDPLLGRMLDAGLRGLEVYRPRNKRSDVLALEDRCERHGLLRTGGSDWHDPNGGTRLGDFHVAAGEITDFLEAVGI